MALFYVFSPIIITQSYKTGYEEMRKVERQLESVYYYNYSEGLLADLREKK